jgi:AraC-like DNA-binding protein
MMLARAPRPSLRPFVKTLWAGDTPAQGDREHSVPTGSMHIAIRLNDAPLKLYDGDVARTVSHGVVGGARSSFYVRDISKPVVSVGAQLYPGAAEMLFGVPADELAERHTSLDDLWGRDASLAREQIAEAKTLQKRLDVFENILAKRIPQVRGVHPMIANALAKLEGEWSVNEIVDESGVSHRHFIALFKRSVGLAPKTYARILRVQKALTLATNAQLQLVDVALDCGYSDQAHLTRELKEVAGVSPSELRRIAPANPNHLAIHPRPGAIHPRPGAIHPRSAGAASPAKR